jgi:hypothetical protein
MNNVADTEPDLSEIKAVVQQYIDGAISGRGDDMKSAFHPDATIFGYVGPDLFAGPIRLMFDWNDENGPASGLQSTIANIELAGTVATVRLELDDWTGHQFTDLFTLLKYDGQWCITNKVFHLHG